MVALDMNARQGNCRATAIRTLNDAFRRTFVGGRVVATPGIASLADEQRIRLLEAVQRFETFEADNDPYAEHDFGAIDQDGERFFWKIDAYDRRLQFGSPDPANPRMTTRVLTVMRADEY